MGVEMLPNSCHLLLTYSDGSQMVVSQSDYYALLHGPLRLVKVDENGNEEI